MNEIYLVEDLKRRLRTVLLPEFKMVTNGSWEMCCWWSILEMNRRSQGLPFGQIPEYFSGLSCHKFSATSGNVEHSGSMKFFSFSFLIMLFYGSLLAV